MRLNGLDLNLLVALDALLTERNLTAGARNINLSQPAMSAAVGRLRTFFKDDLFIMRGRKLVPTPLAESLAAPTREALLHIQLTIASREAFDPAKSDRRFRVVVSDFMTIVFFRRIIERVARAAPGVSFELLPFDDQPDEPLQRGEIDFLIFPEIFMPPGHPKTKLFDETMVCVGCRSNRQLTGKLTFEKYMSMGHVMTQVRQDTKAIDRGMAAAGARHQAANRGRRTELQHDPAAATWDRAYCDHAPASGAILRKDDATADRQATGAASGIYRGNPVAGVAQQ